MTIITCVEDLRQLAQRRVPRMFYDYADSGSWTESTYRANNEDFAKIKFRQRVAVNMEGRSTAVKMVGQDAKIPLVASDTDSVKRGAIAAFGINYRDLGEQTGRMVARILKGEKPGDIKPEISTKMELFVNPGAAEKQGVKLSDALVKSAAQVVQ